MANAASRSPPKWDGGGGRPTVRGAGLPPRTTPALDQRARHPEADPGGQEDPQQHEGGAEAGRPDQLRRRRRPHEGWKGEVQGELFPGGRDDGPRSGREAGRADVEDVGPREELEGVGPRRHGHGAAVEPNDRPGRRYGPGDRRRERPEPQEDGGRPAVDPEGAGGF